MWVDKEVFGLLKEESRHQRELNESLRTKLDILEAHHREQEDMRAQDMREIERLNGELRLAKEKLEEFAEKAKAPRRVLPMPLPAWAKDVDWERVEGGPEQV